MIVVLKHGVSEEKKAQLIAWLEALGLRIHISDGEFQTVLGLIGDTTTVDIDLVESLEIVDSVKRVTEPFKCCNRKFHPDDMVVEIGDVKVGGGNFVMIDCRSLLRGIGGADRHGGQSRESCRCTADAGRRFQAADLAL